MNQLSFKKYNTDNIIVHKKYIYYLQDISGPTTTPKKHEGQPIKWLFFETKLIFIVKRLSTVTCSI